MHNRQGRFKDQGASRGKSENMFVRRLTRVIHTGRDIGFTIVTFDSVPRSPACSYDEFKPFSRPFIRSSLLMAADNEVGFVRSSNQDPKPFPFPLFLDARLSIDTPPFIFTSITKYLSWIVKKRFLACNCCPF